ncbi:FBD-associated F-box protein At2g26860 isoform X2 [Capsella rubella]|uniref:FBD-associated F-box protein At2g26860 isoform X2 n=1 Tax=Capsella rubella TaxID=81985 RepID=UPI000CD5B019|nr:FBD-associated F-box protein At2g26860 isoform X2 [Capsella rubella]
MHMPNLEEAKLSVEEHVEKLFEAVTSVKRLSLSVLLNIEDENLYHYGIVFNQLEHLKLHICRDNWLIHSLMRTMNMLAGNTTMRPLFLNVCWIVLKFSSLLGTREDQKKEIS